MSAPSKESIEKKYEKAFSQLGETQVIFPIAAKNEMAQLVEQISRSDENIKSILLGGQSPEIKGGIIAEEFHAETYNLDAVLKEKTGRAITDKYQPEWKDHGFSTRDKVADIAVTDNGNVIHKSQAKYWGTPKQTSNGLAKLDGKPGEQRTHQYKDADSHIAPSDQVDPPIGKSVADYSSEKAIKEEYKGERPEVAEAHRQVKDKVTDRVKTDDGVESTPLSKKDANKLGRDTKQGRKIREDKHDKDQTASTLKHMGKAAVGAAAISAVASGAYNTIRYCKMVKEGKLTESEAVINIMSETASSAIDSAIKAASVVGAQSILVRHGTKEAARLLAKQGIRSLARTNAVTVGVICGIDLIKDLVKFGAGKITKAEFEERNGKNVLTTTAGVMGGSVGFQIGVAFGFGLAGAGIVGSIAGALIAGLAMQIAIENHIEKPYKELVVNTAALAESMKVFQQVSNEVFEGQVVFSNVLLKNTELSEKFDKQMDRVSEAGNSMKDAIDKL